MGILTKQVQPLTDVGVVWDFMVETYAPDQKPAPKEGSK